MGGPASNGGGGDGGDGGGGDGSNKKKTKQRSIAKPCVFFPRGRCRYGDGCRFSHDVVGKGGNEEEEEEEEVVVVEGDTIAAEEAALDKAEKLQVGRFGVLCVDLARRSPARSFVCFFLRAVCLLRLA